MSIEQSKAETAPEMALEVPNGHINQYSYIGKRTGMPFQCAIRLSMGDKLTVINAARASFNKFHESFDDMSDTRLLHFLAREFHTMPFRHLHALFHFRLPEMVTRQLFRHQIGAEYTSEHSFKDLPWSELSGRYVTYTDVYVPHVFYDQHTSKKQGASTNESSRSTEFYYRANDLMDQVRALYNDMIEANVAREQARSILPMGTYTEFQTTWSMQAIVHFVHLRGKPDAQAEIQDVADVVHELTKKEFGDAYTILHQYVSGG